MDVVALASVIGSATVGFAGVGVALYSAQRTAKTAREGRTEQRAADGYLKVLGLVEQEAQWLDAAVLNRSLDPRDDLVNAFVQRDVAGPAITDRATAAALIAAFASCSVKEAHAAWRQAADLLDRKLKGIDIWTAEAESLVRPGMGVLVPEEFIKELTEDLQPKEHHARHVLAEAVAEELGHRQRAA